MKTRITDFIENRTSTLYQRADNYARVYGLEDKRTIKAFNHYEKWAGLCK